jgi:hypothetical protein
VKARDLATHTVQHRGAPRNTSLTNQKKANAEEQRYEWQQMCSNIISLIIEAYDHLILLKHGGFV